MFYVRVRVVSDSPSPKKKMSDQTIGWKKKSDGRWTFLGRMCTTKNGTKWESPETLHLCSPMASALSTTRLRSCKNSIIRGWWMRWGKASICRLRANTENKYHNLSEYTIWLPLEFEIVELEWNWTALKSIERFSTDSTMGITPSNNKQLMESYHRHQMLQRHGCRIGREIFSQLSGDHYCHRPYKHSIFWLSVDRALRLKAYIAWKLCHPDCPSALPSDGLESKSKSWQYRGIHLHCHLLYLYERPNALMTITSNTTGAVTGSSCIPNPLSPTAIRSGFHHIRRETKKWRAVVVVDIQPPYDIRIRSSDQSCEVSKCSYSIKREIQTDSCCSNVHWCISIVKY